MGLFLVSGKGRLIAVCFVLYRSAGHQNSEIWRRDRFHGDRVSCILDRLSVKCLWDMQVDSCRQRFGARRDDWDGARQWRVTNRYGRIAQPGRK